MLRTTQRRMLFGSLFKHEKLKTKNKKFEEKGMKDDERSETANESREENSTRDGYDQDNNISYENDDMSRRHRDTQQTSTS